MQNIVVRFLRQTERDEQEKAADFWKHEPKNDAGRTDGFR